MKKEALPGNSTADKVVVLIIPKPSNVAGRAKSYHSKSEWPVNAGIKEHL